MMQLEGFNELLARTDKWYLGNGGMLLYAPPFPQHLHVPGFWDECHWGDTAVPALLCVSVVLEENTAAGGRVLHELQPRLLDWQWTPAAIRARHALGLSTGPADWRESDIELEERRSIGPDSRLHCDIRLRGQAAAGQRLHVIAWTMRERPRDNEQLLLSDFWAADGSLSWRQSFASRAHGRGDEPLQLRIALHADRQPDSLQVTPSHGARVLPELRYTPLWDSLSADGQLNGKLEGRNLLGNVIHAGMHWQAADNTEEFALELDIALSESQPGSAVSGGPQDPDSAWREFLSLVPHFECSDPMLTRYYWYRWYGLRLNALPAAANYVAPAVTEGLSYFRGVITYSLMCHMFEARWLRDPELARGCLDNHIAHQTRSGHFPAHIYARHVNKNGFYHTDVGRAVMLTRLHHPDDAYAAKIYDPLRRLLGFYQKDRDREGMDLFDIRDQYETGQEFTSRYFFADDKADSYGWDHKLRLKGVDVSSYVYSLSGELLELAWQQQKSGDIKELTELKAHIHAAVNAYMWDEKRGWYMDYSAQKKQRSHFLAAVGCYPALFGLAGRERALRIGERLTDPAGFWTDWPLATVPQDDPYFSADPAWRGERANCPWNGRVWPMVNSHVCEVLERLAELDGDVYRPQLASFLRRYIEMMHFENGDAAGAGKDLTRPNCFEHYHPHNGSACEYRGVDDYMHSWVADLLLRYVAGVRVQEQRDNAVVKRSILFDPFPFGLESFFLSNCLVAGRELEVQWNRDRDGNSLPGYRIHVDNGLVHESEHIERFEFKL
ncbi:hypothetical protein KDL44_07645 [bacterium]|nr:hypothetical protein [bacterium]